MRSWGRQVSPAAHHGRGVWPTWGSLAVLGTARLSQRSVLLQSLAPLSISKVLILSILLVPTCNSEGLKTEQRDTQLLGGWSGGRSRG